MHHYQPNIIRTPSLIVLLITTLVLIGVTELAIRRLPARNAAGFVSSVHKAATDQVNSIIDHRLAKRAVGDATESIDGIVPTGESGGSDGSPTISEARPSTDFLPVTDSVSAARPSSDFLPVTDPAPPPPATNYLPIEGGGSPTATPNPDARLPISPNPDDDPAISSIAFSANPDNFLPVSPTPAADSPSIIPISINVPSPTPAADSPSIDPASDSPSVVPASDPPSIVAISVNLPTPSPVADSPSNKVPTPTPADDSPSVAPISNPDNTMPTPPPGAPPSSEYLPVTPGAPPPSDYLPVTPTDSAHSAGEAPGSSYYLPISNLITTGSNRAAITSPALTGQQSQRPNTDIITGTAGSLVYSVSPDGILYIGGKAFNASEPTKATLTNGDILTIGPSGAVALEDVDPTKDSSQDPTRHRNPPLATSVTVQQYVLGAFVPTILAVLFIIPWHILAAAVKEMQPFYQLHRPDGALAENSLTLDYQSSINIIATFSAIRKGHFLVWWTGLISLIVLLIAPISSETVFIGFVETSKCTATSGRSQCYPQLSVFPPAARAIQGILAFVAVVTAGLIVALWRVKSGVGANPMSIAGLATLFQHQPLIELFRQIPGYMPNTKHLRETLRGIRCRTGEYTDVDGTVRYGMHVMDFHAQPIEGESQRTSLNDGKKYTSVSIRPVDEPSSPLPEQKRSFSSFGTHPLAVLIFGILVCGLMVLIIYYNRVGADTPFERFMDSESFGTSFLFTAVGVLLKLYWTLLDDDSRTMEPYRQLQQGLANPRDSILLAPHSNPFTGIVHALRHGHIFNALSSLVAILCEPLIVCLANIPFKAGTAFMAYTISTWLSVGILVLMVVSLVWRLIRRNLGGLSRRPDTIAGMLVQICGSHMLGDFVGMAHYSKYTRDNAVKSWGKRYAVGSLVGVDGVERLGVDEDMFFQSY